MPAHPRLLDARDCGRPRAAYADPDAGESGRAAGGVHVAEAVVNTLRRVDLSWVRIEIGLLVGALIMGG